MIPNPWLTCTSNGFCERLREGEGLRTSAPMIMKKPKTEEDSGTALSLPSSGLAEANRTESSRQEQEEALVALIEHRTFEVQHLRQRISYYTSQLEEAEKRLHDSESKLSRLRGHGDAVSSKSSPETVAKNVKVECGSTIPTLTNEGSAVKAPRSNVKASPSHSNQNKCSPVHARDKSNGTPTEREETEIRDKGTKRKFEHKEHEDLISLVRSSSSLLMIRGNSGNYISSQHKRKLRNLALCPVNDQLFVTSALDGLINLWQVHSKGSGISLLSSTDCVSPKERRWPEDVAWHPEGNSLFSVYSADGGDSQISILNLHKTIDKGRVTYLEGKPHVKGIINSIKFLPSENASFVTGGSDHAVILWNERDAENTWKPQALHRNLHSSAVMGVAGMEQKHIVLSAGADKRIFGFDVKAGKVGFKHQIESKCMSVLPNPCDFNLFMVQTGTPEKQLRLFDSRQQAEIHAFGWKQESSESQSALINQAWSPDGLFLTSGSADPVIHVFDIRKDFQKFSIVGIIKYEELILMVRKIAILSQQRKPVTRYPSLLLWHLTEV